MRLYNRMNSREANILFVARRSVGRITSETIQAAAGVNGFTMVTPLQLELRGGYLKVVSNAAHLGS